jgi:hypothetical protein
MSKHDYHNRPEMLDCIFETAHDHRIGAIARGANYKYIPETLIKNNLRWDTAVGATEHCNERVLAFR